MGQEVDHTRFSEDDFKRFRSALREETIHLEKRLADPDVFNNKRFSAGFELEACLLNQQTLRPAADNADFLTRFDDLELASMELAGFNVEFNTTVFTLQDRFLSDLYKQLNTTWNKARECADQQGNQLLLCGILPTLRNSDLRMNNISGMKRYAALNREIFNSRQGKPIQLDIEGKGHLQMQHNDVMLEAAATSFQIHFKTPIHAAKSVYNASIMLSAPILAASTNSPLLFKTNLWEETRIPLFEQSISTGNPLPRVSFGTGYVEDSMLECFIENEQSYPVLLPMQFEDSINNFSHLRLHNGTIWRWNRPLIGFNADGSPHVRIEFRCLPAGPSLIDMVANTAFYFGLCYQYATDEAELLPFELARKNFYQAAESGLESNLHWLNGEQVPASQLLLQSLLPSAELGLQKLGLAEADIQQFLNIIKQRVSTGKTGSHWQQTHLRLHGNDLFQMTADYQKNQATGLPVHEWDY